MKRKSFWLISMVFVISFLMVTLPVQAGKALKVYTNADVNEMEKWAPEAEKAIGMKIHWSPRMSSNARFSLLQTRCHCLGRSR